MYHNNSKKLETTSGGIEVTGTITIGSAEISEAELEILDGATVTTTELNKLDGVTASTTELNYVDGVTSAIQTQINALETRRNANVTVAAANNAAVETRRTNNIAGAVSTITTSDLTASRALVSSGSGKVAVSAVTATGLDI